jgi:hypothetical protein
MAKSFGIGRERAGRLMRLEAVYPKLRLSQRMPRRRIYPHSLRKVEIERSNQVQARGITYVPMPQGWMYLPASSVALFFISRIAALFGSIRFAGCCRAGPRCVSAGSSRPAVCRRSRAHGPARNRSPASHPHRLATAGPGLGTGPDLRVPALKFALSHFMLGPHELCPPFLADAFEPHRPAARRHV